MIWAILAVCISLYMLLPWKWRKNAQDFYPEDRPLIFGHRGSPDIITENTMPSFEHAITQGVDGLEFDIRLSADRKLVIFHDADLMRMAGDPRKIKDLSSEEIKTVCLFPPKGQEEQAHIPLLEEILPLVDKVRVINIEIKSDSFFDGQNLISPLILFIEKHNLEKKCIVSCFNPLVLWRLKLKKQNLIIGFLYTRKFILHSLYNMEWMLHVRPDNLHIHHSLLNSWIVRWAKYKGLRINSYTINKRDTYHMAEELKTDGVFSDNITYLK